jgi:hypothetical protein
MNSELLEESTTAPHIGTVEDHEILELTPEQLSEVAGGGIVHRYDGT